METGGMLTESKVKEEDRMRLEVTTEGFKNLQKEFGGFLIKHTVYETVPENMKVSKNIENVILYSDKFKKDELYRNMLKLISVLYFLIL